MLQAATFRFLKGLEKNNNKEWFDANREAYAAAKANFEALVAEVMGAMLHLEPRLAEQQAKNTLFRIFRDVRFAKDKTPYKHHLSAYFSREGRKWDGAGYYLHLQPGNVFLAAGMWMPQGPLLKAVRQEIDYDLEGLQQILKAASFKKYFPEGISGESLQKVPQGYDADNPAAEYLKLKSFVVTHRLNDADLQQKDAVRKIVAAFAAAAPLVAFLNRAFD